MGVAANGVRSIQLLAMSDCHQVVTASVINSAYIDAHSPHVAEAFLVARDASGKVIWHSAPLNTADPRVVPRVRTPLDRKVRHARFSRSG